MFPDDIKPLNARGKGVLYTVNPHTRCFVPQAPLASLWHALLCSCAAVSLLLATPAPILSLLKLIQNSFRALSCSATHYFAIR